jgi:3-oxoacyl-[acyl-carrier protein] reductase
MIDLSLLNKNAIVCGSTQGIGKSIAIELAELGANVTLVARNEEALKIVLAELDKSKNQKHQYLVADFSDSLHVKFKANEYALQNSIDILVNNTGGPPAGAIVDAEINSFMAAYQSHLLCNHALVQAFLPNMKKNNWGRIINIISTSVKQPLKGLGVSNATRAAVAGWAKTLSFEVAKYGITVNNVLPGATKTVRLENIINSKAAKTNHQIEEIEAEMLAEIPAGRFGNPEEIAALTAFLASPAAAYINGQSIAVDGGRTMAF